MAEPSRCVRLPGAGAGSFYDEYAFLEGAFEDDPPILSLPWHWSPYGSDGAGGPPPPEADAINISLPALGDHWPSWRTSLGELLDDWVELYRNGHGSLSIDADGRTALAGLRDRLTTIAARIDLLLHGIDHDATSEGQP